MYNSPSESKYGIIYSDTEFTISCVYSTCPKAAKTVRHMYENDFLTLHD